jgi:molecular chaperone DnaK (HSP70)
MDRHGPEAGCCAVGLDVGTANACVATASGGAVAIVPDGGGERVTPAVAAPGADGALLTGTAALQAGGPIAVGFKRLLGATVESPAAEAAVAAPLPLPLAPVAGGGLGLRLGARVLTPVQLYAALVRDLCGRAEVQLQAPVTQAVLTVPGWFDPAARRAVIEAARLAGLDRCALCSEAAATALAYAVHRKLDAARFAVVAWGAGGLDVAIVRTMGGVCEVLGAAGLPVGGDDVVAAVAAGLVEEARRRGLGMPPPEVALGPLRAAAAAAIAALVEAPITSVDVTLGPERLQHDLSRAYLEGLARPLVSRFDDVCQAALDQAGVVCDRLDAVVLAGGFTRMPAVEGRVRVTMQRPLTRFNTGEVTAAGAATLAAIATGEIESALLIETVTQPVMLRLEGGPRQALIPARAALPARATRVFATSRDRQEALTLELAQGDGRPLRLAVSDLPPAPAGATRVQLDVTLTTDGLLAVEARDTRSGRPLPLTTPAAPAPAPEAR